MNEYNFTLNNEKMTLKFGALLASVAQIGDCFALFGDLGAGKTTFARGFINEKLQSEDEIPSPTFTIVQTYEIDEVLINHFDLYRVENKEEIWELGWEELNDSISLIEWPQRAGNYLPSKRIEINFQFNAAHRIANIKIFGNGDFEGKWNKFFESNINDFV